MPTALPHSPLPVAVLAVGSLVTTNLPAGTEPDIPPAAVVAAAVAAGLFVASGVGVLLRPFVLGESFGRTAFYLGVVGFVAGVSGVWVVYGDAWRHWGFIGGDAGAPDLGAIGAAGVVVVVASLLLLLACVVLFALR